MLAEPPKPKKEKKKKRKENLAPIESFAGDPKNRKTRLVLAIVSSLSLLTLYMYFLNSYFGPLVLAPMDIVESAIFYTMILRALGLSLVPALRKLHPQVKILIFSVEAFVLCFLILAFIYTGQQGYSTIMSDILTSWIGTTLVVLTPYSFYELAILMYKGTSLTALFVSSTPLVAISFFLSSSVGRNPPSGFEDFGRGVVDSLRTSPGLGVVNSGVSSIISSASIVFFLSILVYVAFTLNESSPTVAYSPKYHFALALMLVGSLVSYVWLEGVSSFLGGNVIEILSAPAVIVPLLLWLVTRRAR